MRRRTIGSVAALVALLLPCSAAFASPPGMVLDPGFGTGGLVTTATEEGSWNALGAALPDGGLVVSGGGNLHPLNVSGGSGEAFGAVGTLAPPPATGDKFELGDFTVDPQGRLLVVGTNVFPDSENPSPSLENGSKAFAPGDLRIVRYLADGALDPSFGAGGVVETDLGFSAPVDTHGKPLGTRASVWAGGVAVDPQGRIVITGDDVDRLGEACVHDSFAPVGIGAGFVARLTEGGAPNTGFGDDGVIWGHDRSENPFGATAIGEPVVGPEGAITYRSAGAYACEGDGSHYGIGRLTSSGKVDRSFGKQGVIVSRPRQLAAGPDGSTFALEALPHRRPKDSFRVRVTRFAADGKLDRSFGKQGRRTLAPPGSIDSLAIDDQGRVLLAGRLRSRKGQSIELLRLSAAGRWERGFGPHGRIATLVPHLYADGQVDAFFDPRGRLLVVQQTSEPLQSRSGIVVARYLPRS